MESLSGGKECAALETRNQAESCDFVQGKSPIFPFQWIVVPYLDTSGTCLYSE